MTKDKPAPPPELRRKPRSKVRRHPFKDDGIQEPYRLVTCCLDCGLPKTHDSHNMPPNPAAELEARRLGDITQDELDI